MTEETPSGQGPKRMAQIISLLLVAGLCLAVLLVISGEAITLSKHAGETTHYRIFVGEPSDYKRIEGVLKDLALGKGRAVIQFGIIVLMLTPVARVGFAALAFAAQRDTKFTIISCIVLAALLYSLICTT